MLYRTTLTSPIGPLHVVASDDALVAIHFGDDGAEIGAGRAVRRETIREVGPDDHPVLAATAVQLAEYFAGTRTAFDLPLAPLGTAFQHQAWSALRTIPYATTVSYGEQAAVIGDRRKARAVGAANGRNPIPIVVPCHRVVGATGHLTGFAGGLDVKAWLLDHELRVSRGA